jgi:hypothetical protein
MPLRATADTITYTETFLASGTVNGRPFNGQVSFGSTTQTGLIFTCDLCVDIILSTPPGTASVSIGEIGKGTSDFWSVFDNQTTAVAGFSQAVVSDVVDLSNPAFASYDLKNAIGPLDTTYDFTSTGTAIRSSLGPIVFDSFSGTPTFQAAITATPEPGSLALFGCGIAGLAAALRRKLRL